MLCIFYFNKDYYISRKKKNIHCNILYINKKLDASVHQREISEINYGPLYNGIPCSF